MLKKETKGHVITLQQSVVHFETEQPVLYTSSDRINQTARVAAAAAAAAAAALKGHNRMSSNLASTANSPQLQLESFGSKTKQGTLEPLPRAAHSLSPMFYSHQLHLSSTQLQRAPSD